MRTRLIRLFYRAATSSAPPGGGPAILFNGSAILFNGSAFLFNVQ